MGQNENDQAESGPPGLSLNEYAARYGVSISTLRRRIRAKCVHVTARAGKYFLEDAPLDQIACVPVSATSSRGAKVSLRAERAEAKPGESKKNVLDPFLKTQQDLLRQLELKDQKILDLTQQIGDLKTLSALLEKENKALKTLSGKERDLEDWLVAGETEC